MTAGPGVLDAYATDPARYDNGNAFGVFGKDRGPGPPPRNTSQCGDYPGDRQGVNRLMSYQLVQVPLARPFDEADAAELRAYAKWVKEIMPERIAALESAVRETPGFDSWRADGTPESLRRLGSWFADRVTTRPPTDEELADFLRPGILTAETAPKSVLDHRTLSYVFDVALYLARVFMSENAGVRLGPTAEEQEER